MSKKSTEKAQGIIDFLKENSIAYNNLSTYRRALTHGSYFSKITAHGESENESYEKFEFYGDSILEFLVTRYIMDNYSNTPLKYWTTMRSKLVSNETLNNVAIKIGLKKLVLAGEGEIYKSVINSEKVGADLFESFIAAITIDTSMKVANQFLERHLFPITKESSFGDGTQLKDAKSIFQEYIQQGKLNGKIVYECSLIENNMFHADLIYDKKIYGQGQGKSKSEAELRAAEDAISKLPKDAKKYVEFLTKNTA